MRSIDFIFKDRKKINKLYVIQINNYNMLKS